MGSRTTVYFSDTFGAIPCCLINVISLVDFGRDFLAGRRWRALLVMLLGFNACPVPKKNMFRPLADVQRRIGSVNKETFRLSVALRCDLQEQLAFSGCMLKEIVWFAWHSMCPTGGSC